MRVRVLAADQYRALRKSKLKRDDYFSFHGYEMQFGILHEIFKTLSQTGAGYVDLQFSPEKIALRYETEVKTFGYINLWRTAKLETLTQQNRREKKEAAELAQTKKDLKR